MNKIGVPETALSRDESMPLLLFAAVFVNQRQGQPFRGNACAKLPPNGTVSSGRSAWWSCAKVSHGDAAVKSAD